MRNTKGFRKDSSFNNERTCSFREHDLKSLKKLEIRIQIPKQKTADTTRNQTANIKAIDGKCLDEKRNGFFEVQNAFEQSVKINECTHRET